MIGLASRSIFWKEVFQKEKNKKKKQKPSSLIWFNNIFQMSLWPLSQVLSIILMKFYGNLPHLI